MVLVGIRVEGRQFDTIRGFVLVLLFAMLATSLWLKIDRAFVALGSSTVGLTAESPSWLLFCQ